MSVNWDNLVNISDKLYKDLQDKHINKANEEANGLVKYLVDSKNWHYYKNIMESSIRNNIYKMYGECYITIVDLKYLKPKECSEIANHLDILVGPTFGYKNGSKYSFIWKVNNEVIIIDSKTYNYFDDFLDTQK
jgi:hypothetical protein